MYVPTSRAWGLGQTDLMEECVAVGLEGGFNNNSVCHCSSVAEFPGFARDTR